MREVGDTVYLHRCLQHVKTNVKAEAKKRDDVTGLRRLKDPELISPIIDWIETSAWFPSDLEFDTFWRSVFGRMESAESPTDFAEPAMAAYLKDHIFDCTGTFIRATWAYGLGAVPLGLTTYAPNAIERTWRLVKGLILNGRVHKNIAEVTAAFAKAVAGRIDQGAYANLVHWITGMSYHTWEMTNKYH